MPYIIITILGLLVFIVGIAIIKKRQIEQRNYYDAAYKMVKEDYLVSSLKKEDINNNFMQIVPMVYLKLCNSKPHKGYVFNPKQDIFIGRDKNTNSIWVPYPTVSMNQCKITLYNRQLYLQDMNSSNGTIVKKGFRRYLVESGQSIMLDTKDKIIIGETIFKIVIFQFRMM